MSKTVSMQIKWIIVLLILCAGFTYLAITTKQLLWIILSAGLGIVCILFILNTIKISKEEKGVKSKRDSNYGVVICFVILLIFFLVSCVCFVQNLSFRANSVKTKATIYNIHEDITYETKYDDEGNSYREQKKECDLYIKYFVNDKEYKNKLSNKSCKYFVNDSINIYYEKDNPANISTDSIMLFAIFTLVSLAILIVYIVQWIGSKKGKKKKN